MKIYREIVSESRECPHCGFVLQRFDDAYVIAGHRRVLYCSHACAFQANATIARAMEGTT